VSAALSISSSYYLLCPDVWLTLLARNLSFITGIAPRPVGHGRHTTHFGEAIDGNA
jgi:hypothetical protein